MKSIAVALLLFGMMNSMAGSNLSEAKGWRGIVPLQSTRAEVERLLGTDLYERECVESLCSYHLKDANVHINYSLGDCKSRPGGWNVPPDTVLSITVHMKPSPKLSDLNMDLSKFDKRHGHIESIVSYVNDDEGLIIEVDEERSTVMGLYYVPSSRDKHLRCP